MTLTQRRVRAADPSRPDDKGATEPGIKYTCDTCHVDITHSVRIKCAHKECDEIDLCVPCFLEGKELQQHKAWHPYKVVEQHSYPIFSPDWGADEELLLVSGLMKDGLGNWADAATHIGTRTKEDCEKHYLEVYLGVGPNGEELDQNAEVEESGSEPPRKKQKRAFMPPMDLDIKINHDEFQEKKRARIEELRKPHALPTGTPAPLVSAPTNHEVAGFMPGRLEFEHEVDNDAEIPVKDLEFGLVFKYDGDKQPEAKPVIVKPADEDEEQEEADAGADGEAEAEEGDVKVKKEEDVEEDEEKPLADTDTNGAGTGSKEKEKKKRKGKEKAAEEEQEEESSAEQVVEIEDEDELEVKLALLDIYFSKLDKREEAKDLIFDRGLTEYKKIQANEKKRAKEAKDEKELIDRYKVFAKLQTALDYEIMLEGLLYEHTLRKRIAELQEYRRMGITTGLEAEAYEAAKLARSGFRPLPARNDVLPTGARVNAGQHRFLNGAVGTPPPKHSGDSREPTPRIPGHGGRKPPTPLNLANSASLDLLSWEEQELCSSLRILPKPYLIIKELYIRENERRKGLLKRRDARKMMKIDVNKSGRIFDFLVSSGMLVLQYDPLAPPPNPNGNNGSCPQEKEKEHPTIQLGELLDRPSLSEVKLNGGV